MKEKEEFNKYINLYKQLPLSKKKQLLLIEAKKTLAFSEYIKEALNVKGEILYNREILDFTNGDTSEEDLVEALFVYLNSIRENFAQSFNEIINKKN